MSTIESLKRRVEEAADRLRDDLVALSLDIHAHPEIAFQETRSAALLSGMLERGGFRVDRGLADLPTSFRGTRPAAGGRPAVAFLAEYDALPEIGHACGHNIIGTAAVGAGLAMLAVMDDLPGSVQVIGTPAEEGGGGKMIMAAAGVFDGLDAAMMVHPSARTMTLRGSLASNRITFEFRGRASHAAAAPDEGINALDGVIQTFVAVNALRLHLRPDARVHGIVTNGGSAVNVIPDYASCTFSVRALDHAYALEILDRVARCAEGAAAATGTELTVTRRAGYANMIPSRVLADRFAANLGRLGIAVQEPNSNERMGSTDMGNVSHLVPSLHPYLAIGDPPLAGHTVEFREAAASPRGMAALIQAAKAMALTAVDLLADPAAPRAAWEEFEGRRAQAAAH